jgi:hypothetical protein
MVQSRHGAGFVFETLGELGLGNIDGDDAIEACVAGFVDFSHAARTGGREDFVRAQAGSGSQRHRTLNDFTPIGVGRLTCSTQRSSLRPR